MTAPLPTSRRDPSASGEQPPAGSFSLPAGGVPTWDALLDAGLTAREAATRMGVKPTTAYWHARRLGRKFAPGYGTAIETSETTERRENALLWSFLTDAGRIAFVAARDAKVGLEKSERIARRVEEACR